MFEVYGGENCISCKAAVGLLEKNEVEHIYFDVYSDMTALQVISQLGLRSIPQVFVDGVHIGGLQELQKYLNK